MQDDRQTTLETAAIAETAPPPPLGRGGTFAALSVRNYRLYFTGQAISRVGTWMQTVALAWLVLGVTRSGTTLGAVVAVQFTPMLLFAAYGGLLADRVNKRRLLLVTQSALGLLALALGTLTATHQAHLWILFVIAFLIGCATAADNPTRQAFVFEMVGKDLVQNAVSLNSAVVNGARAVGPAVAGVLIATLGVTVCFYVNAASFAAMIVALMLMNMAALHTRTPVARRRGQLREGFRYVRRDSGLLVPLVMMALVGTLAYEFQVLLPILARATFHGGPEAFGALTSVMGAGAVLGGLRVARRAVTGLLPLTLGATLLGGALLAAALAPTLGVELAVFAVVGFASTTFLATGNSTLQLTSRSVFRGRVMALWTISFLGTTPIGGPIVGAVAEQLGGRYALLLGAIACFTAAAIGAMTLRRLPASRRRLRPQELEELD